MKNTKNIFWGIFFVCVAVVILISQLGYLGEFSLFSIIISLLLIPVFVTSLVKLNFYGIFFSAATVLIINSKSLGIEKITPWPVLIAALFASIGLSLIFKRRRFNKYKKNQYYQNYHHGQNYVNTTATEANSESNNSINEEFETTQSSNVESKTSFSAKTQYISSKDFKSGYFSVNFGGLKVYFDGADLKDNIADITLEVNFAGVELFIPKEWKIVNNVSSAIGGVNEKNTNIGNINKVLRINGSITFGGIEITYV